MSSKIETEIKKIKGLISTVKNGYQQKDLQILQTALESFKRDFKKNSLDDLDDLQQMLQEIHCLKDGTGEQNKIVSEIKGVKNEIIKILEENNLEFAFPSMSIYHENELLKQY